MPTAPVRSSCGGVLGSRTCRDRSPSRLNCAPDAPVVHILDAVELLSCVVSAGLGDRQRGLQTVGRRTAVAVLACALLLAGCAQKHEASTTLPPASAAASSSSGAALPAVGPADFPVPAEARQRTPSGVVAFSKYYVDLSNHLLGSLDSQPLRDLSHGCQTCTELANGYDEARQAGYRAEGGELSVTSIGSAVVNGNDAEISMLIKQAAVTVRDASGARIDAQSTPAFNVGGGMTLRWDPRRQTWLVTQWAQERL